MTNHTTAFFSSKLPYVSVGIFMAAWLVIITSCSPKEHSTDADAQARDTVVNKETRQNMLDTDEKAVVFPGTDSFQQACELIQDQAESLLEEYYRKGTADERLRQIVAILEELDGQWKEKDCQQVFGYMIPEIPRSPRTAPKIQSGSANPPVK